MTQNDSAPSPASSTNSPTVESRLDLLTRITTALSRAPDEDGILAALDLFASRFGSPSLLLMILDHEGASATPETITLVAMHGMSDALPLRQPLPITESTLRWMEASIDPNGLELPAFFADYATDARLDDNSRLTSMQWGFRSGVVLPLRTGGRWQALIGINWTTIHQFTEEEIDIYTRLMPIVASIVTTRRAYQEAQIAREVMSIARQEAEELAQINAALASASDEDRMLLAFDFLTRLPQKHWVSLHLPVFEGDSLVGFQLAASRSDDGSFSQREGNVWFDVVFSPDNYPAMRTMMDQPDRVHYTEHDPENPHGWVASIYIPLWADGRWQGSIQFLWRTPQAFSPELRRQIDALRSTLYAILSARRFYLAAERARQETERRANELATVAQLSAVATTLLHEDALLAQFIQLTSQHFAPQQISLYLLDDSSRLFPVSSTGVREDDAVLPGESSLLAAVVREGRGQIARHNIDLPLETAVHERPAPAQQILSELAVPMKMQDKLIGVLHVAAPYGMKLDQSHLRVMGTLADLIAVAIGNVRSYRKGQALAALEERTRLARELHDSVSQALYGIALGATTARSQLDKDPALARAPLDYVMGLAQAGLKEMRTLIFDLRPEFLEDAGLVNALGRQAELLQMRHGIHVHTSLPREPELSNEVKESVYRVAREALHNIMKHAQATQVDIVMEEEDGSYTLMIQDNGLGFDPESAFPGHLGLQSMRERMADLGGSLAITSSLGQGTRVVIRTTPQIDQLMR